MRIRTALVVGLLLTLGAAGCGRSGDQDDGVASANGGKPSASATQGGGSGKRNPEADQEAFLNFAKCMREHGIPMDDPQMDDGRIQMSMPEGTDKEKVDAAQEACKQYMPNGGEPMKADPATVEQMRKFSQCMRDNGITNFPDPSEDGGIAIDVNKLGVDPKSEEFKKAEEKCKQYQPGPRGSDRPENDEKGVDGGGA
ncbi:hypothetical protein KZZ52_53875 [Dactylosporangium sp. AC04546]|uniref:hypothetical protein n=1 Tax=Dactylosporangium sp. AC04546 TaxID=2862460 RepID=UPI001EDE8B4D|nr:hypothetical protein [Dactylosporangium sp. AC04546]WVK82745.1 hypothetical protein KZZ52_53875 [Dactylosporangium sp. AC04546]